MSFESLAPSSPIPHFIPLSGGSHQQQNHNVGLGWLRAFSSCSVPSSGQATAIQIPTCPMSSASVAVQHLELEGPLIDQLGRVASTAVQSACCPQLSVPFPSSLHFQPFLIQSLWHLPSPPCIQDSNSACGMLCFSSRLLFVIISPPKWMFRMGMFFLQLLQRTKMWAINAKARFL